jgi:hypothetical protein
MYGPEPLNVMTERETFETHLVGVVRDVLVESKRDLALRGVETGSLDLVRGASGDDSVTELRIYAYVDGQIADALEVEIWGAGAPTVTVGELRQWFQDQLVTFGG